MPWPRNHTERILVELFEGNAAQFLAVLEALWDSTRRPLQTGGLDEPDLMDVAMELMAAGISLLSGTPTLSYAYSQLGLLSGTILVYLFPHRCRGVCRTGD